MSENKSFSRPLRVLFLANNGASVGHVVRALAIAKRLPIVATKHGVNVRSVLCTTSEADRLLAWANVPVVRIPSPRCSEAHGWPHEERRVLAEQVINGVLKGFCPDIVVVDTFPCGPQLEATGVLEHTSKKVLVRRKVRPSKEHDARVSQGLHVYNRVLAVGEAYEQRGQSDHVVEPIVLLQPDECLSRERAQEELGLDSQKIQVLLTAGGGGDRGALLRLDAMCRLFQQMRPQWQLTLAKGPLAQQQSSASSRYSGLLMPLQRYVSAFDVVIGAAGYNTAHELISMGVRSVLFSQDRTFDDQAQRADQFEKAGFCKFFRGEPNASLVELVDELLAHDSPAVRSCLGATQVAEHLLNMMIH